MLPSNLTCIAAVLQALQLQPNKSVNLILEEAMQTSSRAPDTQAAIASRVQNKVLMLDNPTANLFAKARGTGNYKKVASHLLPCSKRPKIALSPCRYTCNHIAWPCMMNNCPFCKSMLGNVGVCCHQQMVYACTCPRSVCKSVLASHHHVWFSCC